MDWLWEHWEVTRVIMLPLGRPKHLLKMQTFKAIIGKCSLATLLASFWRWNLKGKVICLRWKISKKPKCKNSKAAGQAGIRRGSNIWAAQQHEPIQTTWIAAIQEVNYSERIRINHTLVHQVNMAANNRRTGLFRIYINSCQVRSFFFLPLGSMRQTFSQFWVSQHQQCIDSLEGTQRASSDMI